MKPTTPSPPVSSPLKDASLHEGHRERLLKRLANEGIDNFQDHEIIELLLFFSIPRRDTNKIAHLLIKRYGGLAHVLDADFDMLIQEYGIGEKSAHLLSCLPAIFRRYAQDKLDKSNKPLQDPDATIRYVQPLLSTRIEEVFLLLSLDNQCRIISSSIVSEGTVKEAFIYPRHVVKEALKVNASNVIFAHNHPSGKPTPSKADLNLTDRLIDLFDAMDIRVLDHIIVARDECFSFAKEGILRVRKGK
ncbi:MAG: DNA repair protein RadC [Magnetococcales bacterium]|nr:DNA repair protein RadC [Magnetococcales bacterium]